MTRPKKPQHTFQLRLHGSDLYPERVPVGTLAEIISAAQMLCSGLQSIEGNAGSIRLLDVSRGSATYDIVAQDPDLVLKNLDLAGLVAKSPDSEALEYYMLNPFKSLSRISKSLDCAIEFILPTTVWSVGSDSYPKIRGNAIVHDEVVVGGELVRVGGATEKRCVMRIPGRDRLLYCKVENSTLSRQLGNHLYREVVLSGTGMRFTKTWDLLSMHVYGASYPRHGSFSKYIDEVREITGTGWDVDDPSKQLEQLR